MARSRQDNPARFFALLPPMSPREPLLEELYPISEMLNLSEYALEYSADHLDEAGRKIFLLLFTFLDKYPEI